MKVDKIKLTIIVEVLDIDSAPALIMECTRLISRGEQKIEGFLRATDGDEITWKTENTQHEF